MVFPFQDCFVSVTRGYRNKLLKQPKKELVDGAVPTIRNPDTLVVKPPRKAPLKRSSSLPPPAEEEESPTKKERMDHHGYAQPMEIEEPMEEDPPIETLQLDDPKPSTSKTSKEDLEAYVKQLEAKIAEQEKIITSKDVIIEAYEHLFSDAQIAIIKGLAKKVKWSDDDIVLAAHLRYLSGATSYNFIKDTMKIPLPDIRTLNRRLSSVQVTFGLNDDCFTLAGLQALKMEEDDKFGVLIMDEYSIKPYIEWDTSNKKMTGFVTLPVKDEDIPKDAEGNLLLSTLLFKEKILLLLLATRCPNKF